MLTCLQDFYSANDATVPFSLRANVWYHFAFSYDGSSIRKIYINGVLRATYSNGKFTGTRAASG